MGGLRGESLGRMGGLRGESLGRGKKTGSNKSDKPDDELAPTFSSTVTVWEIGTKKAFSVYVLALRVGQSM
jgi:hypothetical protein